MPFLFLNSTKWNSERFPLHDLVSIVYPSGRRGIRVKIGKCAASLLEVRCVICTQVMKCEPARDDLFRKRLVHQLPPKPFEAVARIVRAESRREDVEAFAVAADVATAVKTGAAAVQATVITVVGWYQIAQNDINDVRRFFNSVSTLAGNFGRFFGGGNSGFTATNRSAPIGTTAVQLLQSDANARQAVQAAASALSAAAAHPSDSTSFGAAAQAYVAALRATAADPADGIRMLMNLASYTPSPVFGTSTISQAMQTMQSSTAALLRRSAQAGLARAVASWQPTSFDDAQTMMKTVTQQFDAEIEIAADAGDDSSYGALRQVRNAIVEDLQARGGGLATLSTFEFNGNLPALVIAHRIYGDASRADQLVQQVQPVNPLFMPASFDALSS